MQHYIPGEVIFSNVVLNNRQYTSGDMDTRVYFKKNGERGKNNYGEFPSIMTGSFNPHTF